jgi:hypothetical protein
MTRMDEALAAAADAAASDVEEIEGKRLKRVRVVTRDGVAVAFYRRVDLTPTEDSTLLTVLLDEATPGRWDALNASELPAGGARRISIRPSERGDWIVAIYGSAPAEASVALIDYEGLEHRVPVDDGLFALMLRAAIQPKPTLTRPRFE